MAATVLGKRSRKVLDEADLVQSFPSSKRRTRRSAPEIYEDTVNENGLEKSGSRNETARNEIVIQKTKSVRPRNKTAKCSVRDSAVPHQSRNAPSAENDTSGIAKTGTILVTGSAADQACSDENLPPSDTPTPTSTRFKDALASFTPSTPKHRVRLAGRLLTPRTSRASTPARASNVYARGRQHFTQSSNGKFIGRDAERSQLTSFISKAIERGVGGCTYVSGPPGTGKSALVQEVIQNFHSVKVAIINCVSLKSPVEVLGRLAEDFAFTKGNPKSLKATLEKSFTAKKGTPVMHLALLDEIDSLIDSDCEVLYSIFEWAMHPASSLILIGIANALDLTDRFLPRMKSRNLKPQLLPFLPYSAQQISTIISEKLRSLLPDTDVVDPTFVPLMHPAAIQLSGKKIASQTGDLRKAFSLVRRALDLIEQETIVKMAPEQNHTPTKQPLQEISNPASTQTASTHNFSPFNADRRSVLEGLEMESAPRASVAHVAKIAASIFNNGTLSRLSGLNLQQKAVLCSLVASENRQQKRDPYTTPSKSWSKIPTIKGLFEKYAVLCKRDEGLLQPLKNTEFRDVVASLETLGLIHEASGRTTSLLTPTKTPSRSGKTTDDKQVVSGVSEKEMRDSLKGPGSDLLLRLLDEE